MSIIYHILYEYRAEKRAKKRAKKAFVYSFTRLLLTSATESKIKEQMFLTEIKDSTTSKIKNLSQFGQNSIA